MKQTKFILYLVTLSIFLNFIASPKGLAIKFFHKKDNEKQPQTEVVYSFKKYNEYPGKIEFDMSKYTETRQVESIGVISPDKSKISYTAEYFYPNALQASSRIFVNSILPDDSALYTDQEIGEIINTKAYQRNSVIAAEIGLERQQRDYFNAFSLIDWSKGSDKILFKETAGEYLRGIWSTHIWVYDLNSNKAIKLEEARKAVLYFWKNYKKFDLSEWRWDITPLGWDASNHHQIIFTSYGYNKEERHFLGVWTIDSEGERTKLISLKEQDIEIAMNGLELVKKEIPLPKKKNKKKKR